MKKTKERIGIFTRFCTVGVGNTLIDFAVFFLLVGIGISYVFAQILSYIAGMTNSYIWNRLWTFQMRQRGSIQEITRFVIMNLASLAISFLTLSYMHEESGMSLFLSKGIATAVGMLVTFIGSQYWVFKVITRKRNYQES
ncbi:GtrA family protein [Bacillus sp. V3B]|uniref:GtrA family protein n=1 Tax=Bacillus sp. V3B TaxID=2804915 RepID=UPI002109A11A|nr:GtrA family protein [Bacillus sp. V3B]MCQ6275262.1 GtrA family protein [Bacillus sp. V3B]